MAKRIMIQLDRLRTHRSVSAPAAARRQTRAGALRRTIRSGAALLMALFVMTVSSMLVVTMLDTQALQYASQRNTLDYDRARYMAEAGVGHALALLEQDFGLQSLRDNGIALTQFPPSSGDTYSATVTDLEDGTVIISAEGTSGQFTRRLEIVVKMGG